MPTRDPGYPPPPGQGRGTGRHAGGPGYVPPGGRRPGAPGQASAPGHRRPAEAPGTFEGGYAQIIRASDHPVRPAGPARPPGFGRLAEPPRPPDAPGPANVFVYRDTGDHPGGPAAAVPGPGENDAAYWYDLPGTGAGTDAPAHAVEEGRGPFEPLVSSAGGARPDDARENTGHEDTTYDRARKLEQIKDLYLTAEAIGEANVDKHFDQLLAQQRELIGDYFRQAGPARPPAAGSPPAGEAGPPARMPGSADQAETDPGAARDPGPPPASPAGPADPGGPSEGARVAADQPRAW